MEQRDRREFGEWGCDRKQATPPPPPEISRIKLQCYENRIENCAQKREMFSECYILFGLVIV